MGDLCSLNKTSEEKRRCSLTKMSDDDGRETRKRARQDSVSVIADTHSMQVFN